MPATVIVNKLTVVHKTSQGVSFIFPDVCKTPSPGGPVPIPYPNTALSADTANGSATVKADGNPMMLKSSYFATSTGDEAGTALGVVSNKIKGKAYPKSYSFDVKVEGKNVFRLTDLMLQNGGSPTNTPLASEVQPPNVALTKVKDPDVPKITKITWDSTNAVCGDEVKITVQTEHVDDGDKIELGVNKKTSGKYVGTIHAPIKGNKSNPSWKARRGLYANNVELDARAIGLGAPAKSTNLLKLAVPEQVKEVKQLTRTTPVYKWSEFPWEAVGSWRHRRWYGHYGWEVCYEIAIKAGELIITRMIDFVFVTGLDPRSGVANPHRTNLSAWKREIEKVWDKKFKIHRKECKRGAKCNCSLKSGCCVWSIRVKCKWGPGHGSPIKLHADACGNVWGKENEWWFSGDWWESKLNVPDTVRAHEFGHLIGMYDEYLKGACDPARKFTNNPDSIMSAGNNVFERHFKEFHNWFDEKARGNVGETVLLRI